MRRKIAAGVGVTALVALFWPVPASWFAEVAHRQVLAEDGRVLAEQAIPSRGRAHWVELDQISKHVVDAVVASEDQRFWSHPGVDPLAILRAARADVRAGTIVQGGSTLTMQTARLLAGRPPGLLGKGVEAWRAVRLDLYKSKDEILTWYLNRAYFGHGATGIQSAALRTFDESASSLSLAEAALLIGILPAPSRLHPSLDPKAAHQARDRVLERMLALELITAEEADLARAEPIELRGRPAPSEAPHFVSYLLANHDDAAIQSTLDLSLQHDVEAIVAAQLADLEGREVDHAAVLVVELESRSVRAWVGSGDASADDGQNDGVRMLRSPGSTLKPFLYTIAFEEGSLPSSVIADLPVQYTTTHGSWAPRNYSEQFSGPITLRAALATSANVPAVRLLDDIGVSTMQERLLAMDMPLNARASTYGLGLTLGSGEITLEQLVAGYTTLASGGIYAPLRSTDSPVLKGIEVFDAMATWQVADVLSDQVARTPAFGRRSDLSRAYPAAAKTGTSTGFRDNWTVGFTDRWVVGVWVGNFDGRPMGDVSGITGAGPIWARVMDRVTELDAEALQPPGPTKLQTTCALSGMHPGEHCPHTREERVPQGVIDTPSCDWHDACGVRWPAQYLPWATEQGLLGACAGGALQGAIAYPVDGSVLYIDPRLPPDVQKVPLRAAGSIGSAARWLVDGVQVAAGPVEHVAMWTPKSPGAHRVELFVDGISAGDVQITVGGVRAP